jgi:putative salt-induced outer membrane protein
LLLLLGSLSLPAETVVLHLKNGDRVAGKITSEDSTNIVLETPWAKALNIPLEHLVRRETLALAPSTNAAPVIAEAAPTHAPTSPPEKATAAEPIRPKPAGKWKTDIKVGTDMIRGEKDRDIFYGQFGLTYAQPYKSNAAKYFRNKLDYRADYATTDGNESANRMFGSNKTDFDVGQRAYVYDNIAAGYDRVRKIDSQFEVGPGVGYHLLRKPAFAANVESGLTYQFQDREGSGQVESLYARLAQDCTWNVFTKITFTQRSALLMNTDNLEELQFRLEGNLAFGIVQNLSLNLTALELYDTRPVPGVSRNEFQLRSSLGITF